MNFNEMIFSLFIVIAWVFGIALSKGFWMTLGSVFLPPMAWIIFAQWILERVG